MEYIVFGAVIVVVALVFLIYQKVSKGKSQDNDQVTLSNINERLGIIENAQKSIEYLNTNLIDFKNLFNDKTQRGKLGEEYLEDIIQDCLIQKHYTFQHTLTNGKRPDCLLKFGSTNENICIDSKFLWENYERFQKETNENYKKTLIKEFTEDVNKHIKAISEKYVINGETAPIAIMFVASESVFRTIETISEDFIKKARQKNVIITSPNTMWSFLRTYKLLIQNREMYEQTHVIQKEVSDLGQIIKTFENRFKDLETRHEKNSELMSDIKISVEKISKTSIRIQNLDLDNKKIGE